MVLSFFDKREVKEYLGLFTRNETVCFESWRISIVLLDAGGSDGIAAMATGNVQQDKAVAYRSAYEQITNTMMSILEVNVKGAVYVQSISIFSGLNSSVNIHLFLELYMRFLPMYLILCLSYPLSQATNTATDHIPTTMYDYEIFVTQPTPCGASDNNSNNKLPQKDIVNNNNNYTNSAEVHRRSLSVGSPSYR